MSRQFTKDSPLTAFGDLRVAELSPIFQGTFEYTVDNTDLNVNGFTGSGTIIQAQAMAVISSGTTSESNAHLGSKQHSRYRAGLGGLMRFTAKFTMGIAGTNQYIGLVDEIGTTAVFNNGFLVGFTGATFGFHRFQDDVLISVDLDNWDDPLDGTGPSGMTIDLTKLNVFFIQYQYLGAGPIRIWVQPDDGGSPFVAHTVTYSNQNDVPSAFNANFHFTIWADNGVTNNDIVIRSGSYGAFVEGHTLLTELHQPEFSSGSHEKTTVIADVAILTIRNKATYASKGNFLDLILLRIAASVEASSANNLANIRVIRNATLGGTPAFTDINTSNSIVEIDVAGTTVTGGTELISAFLAGKNDKTDISIQSLRIILNPGETITVAGSSANAATIDASILWRELI